MRTITLILAATIPHMGIGKNGTLPWKLAAEMSYFRNVTSGNIVIMGRKTWESIPVKFRPLKNRHNVIITRNPDSFSEISQSSKGSSNEVLVASSLNEALDLVADLPGRIFIIGGAQLYEAALNHENTKHLLLTEIDDNSIDCDTFFKGFVWSPEANATTEIGELPPPHGQPSFPWKRKSLKELQEFVHPVQVSNPNHQERIVFNYTLWEKEKL